MKKTIFIVSLLLIASLGVTQAQNVFKKYGFKKEVLTLSKGKYQEIFKNEEFVQIGTVLVNTKTNKVVKFLNEDTTKTAYNAELSSRFLTIDPLAEKYYSISPYAFCANNPIKFVDPDGMDIYYLTPNGKFILALKENKDDKVFSLDANGRRNGKEITISDKKLLPQLASGNTAETLNSKDAFGIFKFASDNSKPEWSLKGYSQEKSSDGYLLTKGSDDGEEVSSGNGNFNPNNLVFNLHSHPEGDDNLGPSGWINKTKVGNSYTYTSDFLGSDCNSMLIRLNRNANTDHYIYHEGDQKLIYYDQNTSANKQTQNSRGVSVGTIKSATLMRTIILNRKK